MSTTTTIEGTRGEGRTSAPLRRVARVAVSEKSGKALNPNYFWLTWEYTLSLECGHDEVRARCAYGYDPAPEELNPPLPKRVRCVECPPVPSSGRPGKRKPDPVFDPVVGRLVGEMCRAAPALQDSLLEWVACCGRYVPDEMQRNCAYGAVALRVIDTYLGDTRNAHAPAVRAAVQRWSEASTAENRAEVRRATQRLYHAQHRDGDWYAHRGIIDAAKITSPFPHNVDGVLSCPTWDNATRSGFYNRLWAIRREHDDARALESAAFLDEDLNDVRHHSNEADTLREELTQAVQTDQPVLGEQHVELAISMLAAYQNALEMLTSEGGLLLAKVGQR